MATGNMVPYSNPAGNNQTTPSTGKTTSTTSTTHLPGAASNTAAATNPLVPTTASSSSTSVPNIGSSAVSGGTNLEQQLTDIYGSGEGGAINSFLNSLGGTDSTILQEYIKSLQPQMATAQANTNAALGVGGVSANSSVTALADANLQSQEFSAIANESAKLTQSQEQMTEQVLMGIAPAAEAQTSSEAGTVYDVLGSVVGAIPIVGSALGAGFKAMKGGDGSANAASTAGSSGGSSVPASMQGLDTGDANFGGW